MDMGIPRFSGWLGSLTPACGRHDLSPTPTCGRHDLSHRSPCPPPRGGSSMFDGSPKSPSKRGTPARRTKHLAWLDRHRSAERLEGRSRPAGWPARYPCWKPPLGGGWGELYVKPAPANGL